MSNKLWGAGLASELLYRKDLSNSQKLIISIISGLNQGECNISLPDLCTEIATVLTIDAELVSLLILDLADKGLFQIPKGGK